MKNYFFCGAKLYKMSRKTILFIPWEFSGEGFRIFLRYVNFITVQHETMTVIPAADHIDKSAQMRLFQVLKRDKRKATKNSTMTTRVEMVGNDLWSIAITKKSKKEETPVRRNSNKLAVFIFSFAYCLYQRTTSIKLTE